MRQFGQNTKFGPQTESDCGKIRPQILVTSNEGQLAASNKTWIILED